MTRCHCGSKKDLEECCLPLIAGKSARTAEALMRSRYTAFVLGDLDYIQKTSAGEALLRFDRPEVERTLPGTEWLGLEIGQTFGGQEGDTTGVVQFEVSFRESGRLHKQAERSEFRRIGPDWRYWKGDVALKSDHLPGARIGRNDPCHCGSGKKFKKCCGAR